MEQWKSGGYSIPTQSVSILPVEPQGARAIATVRAHGDPELAEARGALMAAAPDLRETCKDMANLLEAFHEALAHGKLDKRSQPLGSGKRYSTLARDVAKRGRTTIAKATPAAKGPTP